MTNDPNTEVRDHLVTAAAVRAEGVRAFVPHLNNLVFRPIDLPLFGAWKGVRGGQLRNWFSDPSMINPHVASLHLVADRLQARFANADMVLAEVDLTRSFVVRFSRYDYGNGTSEVNIFVHHAAERLPRIGFKTVWPTHNVRTELSEGFELLPFVNPFKVHMLLTRLKELSEVYGSGWNLYHKARVDEDTLRSLRSDGDPLTCPGCWQQRLRNPDETGPLHCPLDHH